MGVLGKLWGGVLGFAIGGPIGALVGAAAGHMVADRKSRRTKAAERIDSPEQRQAAFMFSVVILAAKLCKVDGRVTRDEIAAFRKAFAFQESEIEAVGVIFNQAKQDAAGYEIYAHQVFQIFGHDREMCRNVIAALLSIASVDGNYHPAERQFIADVAGILGIQEHDLRRLEFIYGSRRATQQAKDDPYEILGVRPDASDEAIKQAHRKILKENHPDLAMARGLPEEMRKIGERKLAAANDAYDRIKELRAAA